MLITIYDKAGNPKVELSPNDSSTQVSEIQGDSVLTLSFAHYEHIDLDVDDYADFEGERYWLTEKYRPKQKSTKEWGYDIKLYGVESMIKRLLVIKTVDNEDEPVFTLTAPPREHVAMIVRCMNDGMGTITDWKVGQVDGTENIVIDYFGKYCDQALKEIAEKVGAEWWAEGQTVNICKCEHGEPVVMGYDKGLTGIEPTTADNVDFYTRLYPVGSSRNIDREKYGYPRLQLPGGRKYVEMNADKYGRVDHYEANAFADIYPRRTGVVSSVRSEVKTGEDGNPFTIYYFRDDSLPFDPNDYEIGGLVKRVSFQEGSELGGLGDEEDGTYYFEVNFNSDTREFEIITIWPYDDDTQLPGGTLVPKAGDRYILWNLRMPDEYYALAEEEFLTAVNKYNADHNLDLTVYKASTDHVWIEDNGVELTIGRRVRLESEQYFPEFGYRDSRITKITRKVNLPSQMDIEIGDALSRTSMQRMSDSVSDAKSYARSIGESTTLPDIIRTWDKTLPTDNNLFSARRSQREFISKNSPDRAKKKIIFEEGVDFGDFTSGIQGGGIDGRGSGELLNLILRGFLSSPMFADGFAGEGWRIWLEDGLAHLTVDELTVRKAMTVFELLIEKIRAVGGQICVSAANGKIKTVEEDEEYYYINFENANEFISYDLIRCQTFTQGHLKSYWVAVEDSDAADGVSIAKSEFEGQSAPAVGDDCVLMGNTKYANRQNLIIISATEDGEPRVDVLDGVKSKSFAGCLRARLGALDGITDAAFGDDQPQGHGLYSDNVYLRGRFVLTSGEEVLTRFAITEGKITSAVDSLRGDVDIPENFITNPMLADGTKGWDKLSAVGGGTVLPATVIRDSEDRPVLSLNNGGVTQTRASMKGEPEYYPTNESGLKEPVTVYLSFLCKSSTGGRISAGLYRTSRSGFVKQYTTLSVEEQLPVSNDYQLITASGLWNGEGALWIEMAGEVKVYKVTLSVDKLAARYRTLFEQSDKLIKLSAENFNDDGSVKSGSYIEQTAEEISAGIEENIDGKLRRTGIDITSGEIDLISDKVRFVDSQGNEQVFISNGIINSKAIETDSLTAGKLEMYEREADGTRAANPTVRITPESKGMHILDKSSGEIRQEFSGKEYAAKDAIFGSGGSGNIDLLSASGGYTFNATDSAPAGSDSEVEIELSSLFYTNSSASVKITAGKIQAYAKTADKTLTTDPSTIAPTVWSMAESTVSIVLRQYDSPTDSKQLLNEWVIATASATAQSRRETPLEDSGSGSSSSTYTYKGKDATDTVDCTGVSALTQGAGYLKLFLVYRAKATKNGGTTSIRYGNSIINNPALAAYYATEVYVARYFGNGFCLGRKADDYVLAMYGTDGMRFEARNGNSGLRMTPSGGVQTLVSGSGSSEFWASVPRLLCRCTYTWNSSANSYTASTTSGSAVSFDGSYPTATRTNAGRVTLVLPSAWTSVFGSLAIRDNLHVAIYGRGAVTGSVINQNQSQLFLQLRNATAAADGSFRIDISLA